jgi:hypothetical protein
VASTTRLLTVQQQWATATPTSSPFATTVAMLPYHRPCRCGRLRRRQQDVACTTQLSVQQHWATPTPTAAVLLLLLLVVARV